MENMRRFACHTNTGGNPISYRMDSGINLIKVYAEALPALRCAAIIGGNILANLTSKELTALEDQIGQEQTLIKKYQAMANMCNDAQIQQCMNDYANKHQQHFNSLITFLQ